MKKPILIAAIVIFLGAAMIAAYFLMTHRAVVAPVVNTGVTSNTLPKVEATQNLSAKITQEKDAGQEYLTIQGKNGSGRVLNFYKQAVDTEEGAVIMADENDYRLSYRASEGFNVLIWNTTNPASTSRQAESRLLSILGSDTAGICRVGVSVWYPYEEAAHPALFCGSVK
jgi:hypothetical protein